MPPNEEIPCCESCCTTPGCPGCDALRERVRELESAALTLLVYEWGHNGNGDPNKPRRNEAPWLELYRLAMPDKSEESKP